MSTNNDRIELVTCECGFKTRSIKALKEHLADHKEIGVIGLMIKTFEQKVRNDDGETMRRSEVLDFLFTLKNHYGYQW